MLEKIRLFEKAALDLVQGKKIPFKTANAGLRHELLELSGRMHAAHFISAEPQTYITDLAYRDIDRKYMGKTALHPVSTALHQEAEQLRSIAIQKGIPITPYEVMGLNWEKRVETKRGQDFEAESGHIPVLTRGDFVSFHQAMNLARRRNNIPAIGNVVPVIFQNSDHFWESIFNTNGLEWGRERARLKRLNIHFTSGEAETVDLLASLPYGQKIDPKNIQINLGIPEFAPDPDEVFGTTDLLKFDQTAEGHKHIGASGLLRRLLDIVGPFQSPTEESHSYEGNAEDEKFRAIYNLFKKLGTPQVRTFFRTHGYEDLSKVKVLSHDGGLGFCLENVKGERRIDLFTKEYFPNSMHKINPMQMSPGVELAYLKRTDGLEVTMDRLSQRVREICAEDPRFTVDDLRAYDTSLFVAASLETMLDAIDRGEWYEDPATLGIVSVFDAQVLRVSDKPQFPYTQKTRIAETENYLIQPGDSSPRSMNPNWVLTGPNVRSYKLLRLYMGASNDLAAPENVISLRQRRGQTRMGLLAGPEMITGRSSPTSFRAVKHALLREFGISTQLGPDVWYRYKEDPQATFAAAAAPTNPYHHGGMKALLNNSSVLYFGQPDRPLTNPQKVFAYLLLIKAMVRNQVFNHTEIVADREAAADVVKLLEHKQMLGLVGQQTKHLLTFSENVTDASEKIAEIVLKGIPYSTPVPRHFYSDGQVENNQCMTMTVYLSASNCNKEALGEVWRVGYLAKMNGFNLKTGGGNDGLMKEINDGFMAAEEELAAKGYSFPNQLINIQCVDTEAIEKPYEGGGIYRCHPDIESREADLQQAHFSASLYGGIGSDEENLGWMGSVLNGLINPEVHKLCVMNSLMDSPRGKVGVYDPYWEIFPESFLREIGVTKAATPEGVMDQACITRQAHHAHHHIRVDDVRKTLTGELNRTSGALSIKFFVPPYGIFMGQPGDLPSASRQAMTTERKNSLA